MTALESMVVNPFFSADESYAPRSQRVEQVTNIEDPLVKKACHMFYNSSYSGVKDVLELEPIQIDLVLQNILKDYNGKLFEQSCIAGYTQLLLLKALRERNHSDFSLTTGDHSIGELPRYMSFQKRLSFKINGNAGLRAGMLCNHCYFKITGDADENLGEDTKNSVFEVMGSAGKYCGDSSINGYFIIEGDAGEGLGSSAGGSVFLVYGDIGEYPFNGTANNCTIKTPNHQTYEKMVEMVPRERGNRVQLLDDKLKFIEGWNR